MAGYATYTYDITNTYVKIQIFGGDAKVSLAPSADNKTKLVVREKKRRPYEFFVKDGTLVVRPTKRKWYHLLKIGMDRAEIRLSVPEQALEEISVKAGVGCVSLASMACTGMVDVQTGTGKLCAQNVTCKNFTSVGNTGSAALEQCTAKESISIKRNTGGVLLNDCSAPEIFAKTNTGSVGGNLPPNTVFLVRTNTGRVKVPKASAGEVIGGRCEIKTNTGSVHFE